MNWKDYENEVYQHFKDMYPDAKIMHDVKILSRSTGKKRQIDILIEDDIADFQFKIIVDVKYFSRKVDIRCVESFMGMMDDVGADYGILVTQIGYTKGAIQRAHCGRDDIVLDILNCSDLLNFQAHEAIPYAGTNAVCLWAPFGWVIDASKQEEYLACLYQRGQDLEESRKKHEWMYLNFWHKNADASSITELVNLQNEKMKLSYEKLDIDNDKAPERKDGRDTYIRVAIWSQLPAAMEITGYIDCEEFIAFFVMYTPKELKRRNVRKLAYVLKYSTPSEIKFDNTKVIKQLKADYALMTDPIEKADAYRQIADWYVQMDEYGQAMEYRRRSFKVHSGIYKNTKPLITGELELFKFEDALNYSLEFFRIEPENPRVMQDLLSIYDSPKYNTVFEELILKLKEKYRDKAEALGNINFHYGFYLFNVGNSQAAIDHFDKAKQLFESIDKDHHVIYKIKNILSEIKKNAKNKLTD